MLAPAGSGLGASRRCCIGTTAALPPRLHPPPALPPPAPPPAGGWFSGLFGGGRGREESTAAAGVPAVHVQGLYMYGGVGVGKTMLMDLLAREAPPHFQVGTGRRICCDALVS